MITRSLLPSVPGMVMRIRSIPTSPRPRHEKIHHGGTEITEVKCLARDARHSSLLRVLRASVVNQFARALAVAALALALLSAGAVAQTATPATQAPPAPQVTAPSIAPPAPESAAPAATPAPEGAAPAAAPAPGAASEELVENPYGLSALWQSGDFIARGTLIALALMSMGTWYILVTKIIDQSLLLRQAREANRRFWAAASMREGAAALSQRSAFRKLVEDGLSASDHHEGTLTEQIDLNSWITMSLQRSVDAIGNRMQGGLAFLATVGSTAPFVGLFGTVWGIYHALTAIGIAGQASIDKVAGPVGEALIMTAMGLAVAVPAVLGYNWMVRRNKLAMDRVRSFAADLHALLIGGARTELRHVRSA
jgi:biopolymer transport protein ExbB